MVVVLNGSGCIRGWLSLDVAAAGCGWLWLAGWLVGLAGCELGFAWQWFICDKLCLGCLVEWLFRRLVPWLFVWLIASVVYAH